VWSVQFDHFLVFCSSYSRCPRAQSFVKWGTCPRALDGVSVTFVLQFHTRKHYKQPFNLNAYRHKDYFLSVCIQSYAQCDTLTRFCKLLTRVATLSGGGGGPCLKSLNAPAPRPLAAYFERRFLNDLQRDFVSTFRVLLAAFSSKHGNAAELICCCVLSGRHHYSLSFAEAFSRFVGPDNAAAALVWNFSAPRLCELWSRVSYPMVKFNHWRTQREGELRGFKPPPIDSSEFF